MSTKFNTGIISTGKSKVTLKENAITVKKNIGMQVDSTSQFKDEDVNELREKMDAVATENTEYNTGVVSTGESEMTLEPGSVNVGENIGVHVRNPLLENTEQENMKKENSETRAASKVFQYYGTKGTHKCKARGCETCDNIKEGDKITSTRLGSEYVIDVSTSCKSSYVVYCITCAVDGCGIQYVGKTIEAMHVRMSSHRRAIGNRTGEFGKHYADHGVENLEIQIVDQLVPGPKETDADIKNRLLKRETEWATTLATYATEGRGLNVRVEVNEDSTSSPSTSKRKRKNTQTVANQKNHQNNMKKTDE